MYEELYQPLPDQAGYLERIGYTGGLEPTLAHLDALIQAQSRSIPFENLDIWFDNAVPELGIPALYDKLICRRRGGYCFELNTLFMCLLQSLGYECYGAAARVQWNKQGVFAPLSHRVTIVNLAGTQYLCDVGFGGPSPDGALALTPGMSRNKLMHEFSVTGEKTLTIWYHGEGTIQFANHPVDPVDFLPLNFYYARNPASYFKSKLMVNLRTDTGSTALDGDVLRIRTGGVVAETPVTSLKAVLAEHFGISY